MVYINLFNDANVLLFTYMIIYNISLIILFWTLFNSTLTAFKTLQSFQGFSFNSFYLTTTTLIVFSMAGVPPFIGFFSKLFILTLLVNNAFVLLYLLFFVLLFIGLFFYIQNMKNCSCINIYLYMITLIFFIKIKAYNIYFFIFIFC